MSMLDKNAKTWETLEKEMVGVTSLLCCQDFNATKQDSFDDNGWGELDEDGLPIGSDEEYDYETYWKLDTVGRMLDENLDYGKYNETEEEMDDPRFDGMYHSMLMDIRCSIADKVAWEWVFSDNVSNLHSAQKLADKLVAEVVLEKYKPIPCID